MVPHRAVRATSATPFTPRRHEFVVVETIDFYDDEDDELPPPLTIKDIIATTKVP